MTVDSYPNWSRGLDILVGITLLVVGFWIFYQIESISDLALNLFAISILLMGGTRIIKGVRIESMRYRVRILNILIGIAVIFLSSLIFLFPTLGSAFLIRILITALILIGVLRIWVAFVRDEIPKWARASQLIVGAILVGIGSIIFVVPIAEFNLLILIISAAILANGALRITNGITGKMR